MIITLITVVVVVIIITITIAILTSQTLTARKCTHNC